MNTALRTAVIVWGMAAAVPCIIFVVLWFKDRAMRRMIFSNLDNAYANGYFEGGEYLHLMGAREIAHDLTCYAEDCEDKHPLALEPYVREWLELKGLAA